MKTFPYTWEQLWKMNCAQIQALGLKHRPTSNGIPPREFFIKAFCTCPQKESLTNG